MRYSYATHLYCPQCGSTYPTEEQNQLCACSAPLLVDYDLDTLKKRLRLEDLQHRKADLWRYHELLPVLEAKNVVSLGEGMTPIISMNRIGEKMGLAHLFMKDEGLIPTGAFKARGAAVGVSKAKEIGVKELAMPTNGNAGASWSLYSAKAGIKATIVMPVDAPDITKKECKAAGANLFLVNGLIGDAGQIVKRAVARHAIYDVSTLKEPYRIEGKKTMGLELAEQFDWQAPDVVLYPTGGGVGLIGIYKAFKELQAIGFLKNGAMPRLVAVQAEGCAPIVKAYEEGAYKAEPWENADTIAFGINVAKALGDFLILDAIKQSNGCAISIPDEKILEMVEEVAAKEGAFICPEGAAAFVAAEELRKKNWINADEKVVVLNTGAGIKYPNTVLVDAPTLQPDEDIYQT